MKNLKKTKQEIPVVYRDEWDEVSKATVTVDIDVAKLDWSMTVKIKAEEVRDENGLAEELATKLGELMNAARADVAQFNRQMDMFTADDDVSARPSATKSDDDADEPLTIDYEAVRGIPERAGESEGFVRQLPEG